jgi:hypothetical protein
VSKQQELVLSEMIGLEDLLLSGTYISAIILCRIEGRWDVHNGGDKTNVSILFKQMATPKSHSNHYIGTMYDYKCSLYRDINSVGLSDDTVLSILLTTIIGCIFTHNLSSDCIDIIKDDLSNNLNPHSQLSFHASSEGWVGQIIAHQLECCVKFKGAYICEILFSYKDQSITLLRPRSVL